MYLVSNKQYFCLGCTALSYAINQAQPGLVKLLINGGASLQEKHENGKYKVYLK